MKDIQDGKKVSIQDGKTEDPAIPTFERGISHVSPQVFIDAYKMTNPKIDISYKTNVTPIKKTATITTVYETSVE